MLMMKRALFHVSVVYLACIAAAWCTSLLDSVHVDVDSSHYAERRVEHLPSWLAMPCNSLINLAYILMGIYWLLIYSPKGQKSSAETADSCYVREVFSLMAILYAPIQWARLATLQRPLAVLDQWFTLPIFAWVPVWSHYIASGGGTHGPVWSSGYALQVELCSILSYSLALLHENGFEVALGCHVAFTLFKAVRVQLAHGDVRSQRYLLLAALSCVGFVVLKLLDHWLAQFQPFQRVTGHFWSKVCDVFQWHYSFCFLTSLTQRRTIHMD